MKKPIENPFPNFPLLILSFSGTFTGAKPSGDHRSERRLVVPHPKRRHTMAVADNPTAIVPYHDPFEFDHYIRAIESFLLCDDDDDSLSRTLNLTELPSTSSQNQNCSFDPNSLILQDNDNDNDNDHFFRNLLDNQENNEAGPSRTCDETNTDNNSNEFGNPIQLSSWPLQTPPYTCTCCQVLREITHTNGVDITKLEVHGRLGVICHAVLEKYSIDLTANQSHEYKMFDFSKESISKVKQFFEEYCEERKRNGYIMLQDPLSVFYEALCVGMDWENSVDTDDLVPLDYSGEGQMNQPEVESSRPTTLNRSSLAMQRERTGKLTMRDFIKYFHFPIEIAAKKIQVCPTVMKKICRKHGLSRWPYRKIKSIERKISMKAKSLTSLDAEERTRAQAEIDGLRQEIANIYARFNR